MWDGITYPFPNFNGATVEVWEWISNIIPHFLMDVIACPWWDQSQSPWTRRRTTLSSALFLKVFAFHKICHWNTFLKVQMTTTQSRFRHVTAPPKGREPITLKHSSRRHICRVCDVQRCKFVGFSVFVELTVKTQTYICVYVYMKYCMSNKIKNERKIYNNPSSPLFE